MDESDLRRFAKEDAKQIIELARREPIGGVRDLRRPDPAIRGSGSIYEYTPELPARRFASDWDSFEPNRGLPDGRPVVMLSFGHGPKVAKTASDDLGKTYWERVCDLCKAYEVGIYLTYHEIYGADPEGQFLASMGDVRGVEVEIKSLYAVDLHRYEPVSVMVREEDGAMPEELIQTVHRPRAESLGHKLRLRMKLPIRHSAPSKDLFLYDVREAPRPD